MGRILQRNQHLDLTLRVKVSRTVLPGRVSGKRRGETWWEATPWRRRACAEEAERMGSVISVKKSPRGFLCHQPVPGPEGATAPVKKQPAGTCLWEAGEGAGRCCPTSNRSSGIPCSLSPGLWCFSIRFAAPSSLTPVLPSHLA